MLVNGLKESDSYIDIAVDHNKRRLELKDELVDKITDEL